jgi:hypothetical protein
MECSPDEARNPGQRFIPDFASLHPGYEQNALQSDSIFK